MNTLTPALSPDQLAAVVRAIRPVMPRMCVTGQRIVSPLSDPINRNVRVMGGQETVDGNTDAAPAPQKQLETA